MDDDPDAAIRLAHTLKGVAGNIGAMGVQEAARELELACQEGAEGVDDRLAGVLAELEPVLAALDGLEQPAVNSAGVRELDRAGSDPLLSRLRALLQDDDTDASDVLDELAPLMTGSAYAGLFARLADQVGEYAFDEALEVLDELQRVL